MKRIVIFVTEYSVDNSEPWLLDDLVTDLVDKGNHVTVLYFDMLGESSKGYTKRNDRHEIFTYPYLSKTLFGLCSIRKINLLFSFFGMQFYFRNKVKTRKVDIVVNYTALFVYYGLAKFIKKRNACKLVTIFWDFYPLHFSEIGHLNNKFKEKLMYFLENREASIYDKHCFMTDEYVRFFRQYHSNIPLRDYEIIYAWRQIQIENPLQPRSTDNWGLDTSKVHAVFGGQLTPGRGLDFLLSCSDYLSKNIPQMVIHILGKGQLRESIQETIDKQNIKNIRLLEGLNREDYLSFLSQCDIGLVITQEGVSVPSFPSKIIDYMQTKKPVIACCSDLSEYTTVIEKQIKCGLGCVTGDVQSFVGQLKVLSEDKELCEFLGNNGYQFMLDNMDVKTVSSLIIR